MSIDDSGERVRAEREKRGLSQESLATATGLSVRTIRDIENGRVRSPHPRSRQRIAEILDGHAEPSAMTSEPVESPCGLDIGVLGPFVLRRGGVDVLIGSRMQRSVLALLAVGSGEVVVRRDIIDVLWGDQPPPSCTNLVHTYVSRLRNALAGSGAAIESAPGGYRLRIDEPDQIRSVDVIQFDDAVAEACRAAADGDLAAAVQSYVRALDLWRGPALIDLDERVRAYPGLVALQRRRVDCVLEYAALAAQLGGHGQAVTHLLAVIQDEPLHEILNARLMLALAQSGQQDKALGVYESVRARLAEDLGIDPGPELRDAHQRIITQKTSPATVGSGTNVRPRPWLGPHGHLTHLIGRDTQVKELGELMAEHRLITIVGPGGCGKSAIALHAAESWHGPVATLPLAALTGPHEPALALASLLGGDASPISDAAGHPLDRPDQLLVIDNAEHLAPAVAALVMELLGRCPALTILVTSRQPLGVSEELVWALAPLTVPDGDGRSPATDLFTERARQALPSVDLSNSAAIAQLTRRVDGLPLALELAACRVRIMGVAQLVERLDGSLDMLSINQPSGDDHALAAERHRTLRAAIDWSYRLLPEAEQRVLAELSVFRGSFTIEAAEAITSRSGATDVAVSSLVDKSLLVTDVASTGSRFWLLETIREYAANRLDESGLRATVEQRHLAYWLERSRDLAAVSAFSERVGLARSMGSDLPDAEAALARADASQQWVSLVELAIRLQDCWNVNPGYQKRGVHWLTAANELVDPRHAQLRAEARMIRGQLLGQLGDPAAAAASLHQALGDADMLGADERIDLMCLLVLNELCALDPAAVARSIELIAMADRSANPDLRAVSIDIALAVAVQWDRTDLADELLARHGAMAATAPKWLESLYYSHRAEIAARRGDEDTARIALADIVRTEPEASSVGRRYGLRRATATVLLALDDNARARTYLDAEIRSLERDYGAIEGARLLRIPYAEALRRSGNIEAARQMVTTGLAVACASGNYRAGLPGVLVSAAVAHAAGDDLAATALADEYHQLRRHLRLPVPLGYAAAAGVSGLRERPGDPGLSGTRTDIFCAELLTKALDWCRGQPVWTRKAP